MKTKNRIDIIGFVGQDPETRQGSEGTANTRFSVATTERWKDKAGQVQERTEWHRVVFWGRPAEQLAKYVHKGSFVEIEGSMRSSTWEKDGVSRTTWEINGSEFRLLDRKAAEANAAEEEGEGEGERDDHKAPDSTTALPL